MICRDISKDAHINELRNQAANASIKITELSKRAHHLELDLTAAHTKLEVQQTVAIELRAFMERQETMPTERK